MRKICFSTYLKCWPITYMADPHPHTNSASHCAILGPIQNQPHFFWRVQKKKPQSWGKSAFNQWSLLAFCDHFKDVIFEGNAFQMVWKVRDGEVASGESIVCNETLSFTCCVSVLCDNKSFRNQIDKLWSSLYKKNKKKNRVWVSCSVELSKKKKKTAKWSQDKHVVFVQHSQV